MLGSYEAGKLRSGEKRDGNGLRTEVRLREPEHRWQRTEANMLGCYDA